MFEVFVIIYFIFAFVFTEIFEIYASGPISYVTDIWNYYEWLMIGIFFSILGMRAETSNQLASMDFNSPHEYVDMHSIASNFAEERYLISMFVLLWT